MDFVAKDTSRLTNDQVAEVAKGMGCETEALWAVVDVESGGSGFLSDGRPKILFEAHIFSSQTGHQYDATHPNISSPSWNQSLYGAAGAHQYDRLEEAMSLDEHAALMSCSWGLFQLMGFNHNICGVSTVEDFVEAHMHGEKAHLELAGKFIVTNKLNDELTRHDWAGFAYGYNGPGYAANQYDVKLAQAYKRRCEGTDTDMAGQPRNLSRGCQGQDVCQLQADLNKIDNAGLAEDGDFGSGTEAAVKAFQAANGLVVDGVVGPGTRAKMEEVNVHNV